MMFIRRKWAYRMVCRYDGYVGDLSSPHNPACPKCGRAVKVRFAEMRWYRSYRKFRWWDPRTWQRYYWGFA